LMKMPIEKNNLLGSYFPTYIQKLFGLGGFGLGTNYFDDKNQ